MIGFEFMNTINKRRLIWLSIIPLFAMACGLMTPISFSIGGPSPAEKPAQPAQPVQPGQPAQPGNAEAGAIPTSRPVATLAPAQSAPVALPSVTSNEDDVLVALYQAVNPAVVNIITYADQGQFLAPSGQGSGFVVDGEGHIVTNAHVVHGSDAVDVVFSDNTTLSGKVVGEDLHADLAVVKVDNLPAGVNPLPLGNMADVHVGQTVVAIGNPFGLGGTLTRGIVSAMGRTIPALTQFSIPQAIQTDAPINPGNSGGPLLNLRGQVIGVNAQIETGDGSRANSGVGFAIPVSIIAKVIPNLIANGKMEWSWIGVVGGSLTPALVKAMDLPVDKGAYIAETVPDGPADKAGLRGATNETTSEGRRVQTGGDVIIAVDGQPVSSFEDILIYLALNTEPGQSVTLTILRDGKQMDVQVTLGARPNDAVQLPGQQQP
jgi:2-alkenal reductase